MRSFNRNFQYTHKSNKGWKRSDGGTNLSTSLSSSKMDGFGCDDAHEQHGNSFLSKLNENNSKLLWMIAKNIYTQTVLC